MDIALTRQEKGVDMADISERQPTLHIAFNWVIYMTGSANSPSSNDGDWKARRDKVAGQFPDTLRDSVKMGALASFFAAVAAFAVARVLGVKPNDLATKPAK